MLLIWKLLQSFVETCSVSMELRTEKAEWIRFSAWLLYLQGPPAVLWAKPLSGSTHPLKYTGKKWLCYVSLYGRTGTLILILCMSCIFPTVYPHVLQSICHIMRAFYILQYRFLFQLGLSCQILKTPFQSLTHLHLLKRTKPSKKKLIMERYIISYKIKCSLSWINHWKTSRLGENLSIGGQQIDSRSEERCVKKVDELRVV